MGLRSRFPGSECFRNEQPEFVGIERFGDVILCAGLHRRHCCLDTSLCRDHYCGNVWVQLDDLFEGFYAIDSRESYVKEGNVRIFLFGQLNAFFSIHR